MAKKDSSTSTADNSGIKIVAQNRRARHEYHILETFEAGLVLSGPEVKSIRAGSVTLAQSFVQAHHGELFLIGAHINPYEFDTSLEYDPVRKRKLLLNRHEIDRIAARIAQKGLTAVPLDIHFRRGRAKLEFALAKGKADPDKRDSIKERESQRDMDRAMKRNS